MAVAISMSPSLAMPRLRKAPHRQQLASTLPAPCPQSAAMHRHEGDGLPPTCQRTQQGPCIPQVGGELARSIAEFEQQSQMTLMHRFNKAADLLDQVLQVRSCSAQWPGTQCSVPPAEATGWFWIQPTLQWCMVQGLACAAGVRRPAHLLHRICRARCCRRGGRQRRWPPSSCGCATAPAGSSPGSATTTRSRASWARHSLASRTPLLRCLSLSLLLRHCPYLQINARCV